MAFQAKFDLRKIRFELSNGQTKFDLRKIRFELSNGQTKLRFEKDSFELPKQAKNLFGKHSVETFP